MTRTAGKEKYTYTLRWQEDGGSAGAEIGYLCTGANGRTLPWSLQAYGGIPSRLDKGATDLSQGENISRQAWQNLHTGGMGASEARDFSTFQSTHGIYTGDEDEIYNGPEPLQMTAAAGLLPTTQRIAQFLPYFVPKTSLAAAPSAGLTATAIKNPASPATQEHGTLATNTVRTYQVSATTTSGESALSGTFASTGTGAAADTGGVYLTWTAVANALLYTIYGRDAAGGPLLLGYVVGDVTKKTSTGATYRFKDDGSITPTVPYVVAQQPSVTADYRHLLIFASDTTDTYVYEVAYSGAVSHSDGGNSLGPADWTAASITRLTMFYAAATVTKLPGIIKAGQQHPATVFRNRIYLPLQQASGAWTTYVFYPNDDNTPPGTPTMRVVALSSLTGHLAYADGDRRLWLFYRNLAFWSLDPTGTQTAWNGPIQIGTNETLINSALVYGGTQSSDSALYLSKSEGLFRILDTEVGPGLRAEHVMDLGQADDANGRVLIEHRGELYISVRDELFRYNIGQVDATTPNKQQGLPFALQGNPRAAASTGRHLYVALVPAANEAAAAAGINHGYSQVIETTHGEAWHQVLTSCSTGSLPGVETNVLTPDRWTGNALEVLAPLHTHASWSCILVSGGESGNQVYRLPCRVGSEKLRDTQLPIGATPVYGYQPRAKGVLTLPPYYATQRMTEKVWHWFQLTHWQANAPAPDLAQLGMEARLLIPGKALSAWQPLIGSVVGAAVGSGGYLYDTDSIRQEFAKTSPVSLFGRCVSDGIQMRFTLTSGTVISSIRVSPVLRDPMLAFSLSNQSLRTAVFNTVIAYEQPLVDGTVENVTPIEVLTKVNLLTAFATNTGVVVLNDPLGNDILCRIDLGYIRAKTDVHTDQVSGALLRENLAFEVQVTATELYNQDAYTR